MMSPDASVYELSHLRSSSMPQARFAAHEKYTFEAPHGMPNTRHGFNTEVVTGNIGGQGTQIDALGHFGVLPEKWNGKGKFPAERLSYYGGFSHLEVKPEEDGKLRVLGVDKIPPIVTTAVLLDAAAYKNNGRILNNNELITRRDILGMLDAQGLGTRGILPGDMLLIYTGWGQNWTDKPDEYYTRGPGLSYDAALFLKELKIVAVALDNPFTDPAPPGMLTGEAQPEGTPDGLPFAIHHQNLSQSGIYQIQNANLTAIAKDKVWLSCAMVAPLKIDGGAQSPVSPVAIGHPFEGKR